MAAGEIHWIAPDDQDEMVITEGHYGGYVITVVGVAHEVIKHEYLPYDIIPLADGKGAYVALCIQHLQSLQENAPDEFFEGLACGLFIGEVMMRALSRLVNGE